MKKLIAALIVTHWFCYTWGHVKGWDARGRASEWRFVKPQT